MERKLCTHCNIEKNVEDFYNKYRECKICNIKRGVKRYFDNKDKISIQQKIYDQKKRFKLLQKQNYYRKKRNTDYEDLVRSYVELQNRLKMVEEKFKINESENN